MIESLIMSCPLQSGLLMGVLSLVVLWLVIESLGRWIQPSEMPQVQTEQAPAVETNTTSVQQVSPVATTPAPIAENGIEPYILAIIAASLQVTLNQPHHILRIAPPARFNMQAWEYQSWSEEGRRQIYSSHRLR